MNNLPSIACCQGIPSIASHHVSDALIGHMLITDYYDGAISGFVRCPACSSVYHFVTLDWDQSHFVRVIALSLVPPDSMAKLKAYFSEPPPGYPWIPKKLQRASDQDLDHIEALLSSIIAQAQPPNIVMAWDISTSKILSACKVGSLSPEHFVSMFDGSKKRKKHEWFRELGVEHVETS